MGVGGRRGEGGRRRGEGEEGGSVSFVAVCGCDFSVCTLSQTRTDRCITFDWHHRFLLCSSFGNSLNSIGELVKVKVARRVLNP